MKSSYIFIIVCFLLFARVYAQIPNKPINETFYINLSSKFPHFINEVEANDLEQQLKEIDKKGNVQVCILVTDTLNGMVTNQYAVELANKWGIGTKEKNNGIVIIINPNNVSGERLVYMIVGYELEGVFPDLVCKQICDTMTLNYFSKGNYYKGIINALRKIKSYDLLETENYGEVVWQRINEHTGYVLYTICWFVFFFMLFLFALNVSSPSSSYRSNRERDDYDRNNDTGSNNYGGGNFGGGGAGSKW